MQLKGENMQSIEQAEQIGKQFVEAYYSQFKNDKSGLGRFYQDQSILTWEGQRFIGSQAISQRLAGLPFGQIEFQMSTLDCQPTITNGVLVFVTGQLITEGESKPLKFSQIFHLLNANNSWVLANDMFRLNYA
jgi:hypothetical protein